MKIMRLSAVAIALCTASAAIASSPPQPTAPALDAAAVRGLLAGNTMDAVTALERFKDKVFHVHIRSDGTLTILNFNGQKDTGIWEVRADGHYCNKYANTRKKMLKCFTVHGDPAQGWELRTKSGALSSRFTVRKGNPDNL